jgi:hypothetical protein
MGKEMLQCLECVGALQSILMIEDDMWTVILRWQTRKACGSAQGAAGGASGKGCLW